MKTQDLRTNDVKKEIKDGIEIYIYKGIEIDKSTWENAPSSMFCGKITDDNMRQLVIYLYDAMVSVYGEQDVKKYVKIKKMLANGESCDYNDIQYHDEMDQFRWNEEEILFNSFGAVYYEDIEEDDENYVRAYATNIQWNTKCGDEFDDDIVEYLPSRVEIPFFITDDKIADMLYDEYGYCVISFEIEQC